jgi:WD40 repeat protein
MTLKGHTRGVTEIVIVAELSICSCSRDGKIIVWNINTGICERTIEGQKMMNNIALLLDGRICSVSSDGFAKIWNIDTGVCEHAILFVDHIPVKVVQLHDGRLVVSDREKAVTIIGG